MRGLDDVLILFYESHPGRDLAPFRDEASCRGDVEQLVEAPGPQHRPVDYVLCSVRRFRVWDLGLRNGVQT